jgi:hypothetical protein
MPAWAIVEMARDGTTNARMRRRFLLIALLLYL